MMFITLPFLLLLTSSSVLGDSIYFEDCLDTPSRGIIRDVGMVGCSSQSMDDPCEVSHGDTVEGTLVFETSAPALSLHCEIYGVILGVTLPFTCGCPNAAACADLDPGLDTCPLEAGDIFTYHIAMDILPIFPTVDVIGKWTLKDENNEILVCFRVPIRITE